MKELVIITIITVIKLTYSRNSIEGKKKIQTNKQTNKQTNLTWLGNWSGKYA